MNFALLSCGKALPNKVVDNHHFASYLETSDAWIQERTGIQNRRYALEESTYSLGLEAAQDCLRHLKDEEINHISVVIFMTLNPQRTVPYLAASLQEDLDLPQTILSFDLNAACSGYVYAMELARHLLVSRPPGSSALLVASEVFSEIINPMDRGSCILFGDGASASLWTLNESSASPHLADHFLAKTISQKEVLYATTKHSLVMDGRAVYRFAVTELPQLIRELCVQTGIELHDIDLFIFHQANQRILETVANQLGLSKEKIPCNIAQYGNTSSASVGLLLTDLWQAGKLSPQQTICFAGFGAGLSLGALILKGDKQHVAQREI